MKPKIFLVEDEGIVAMNTTEGLESLGYDVVGHAFSADEAIDKVKDLKPDIALLDINLCGELDGIDAASVLSTKHNIPIIFVTAHADESTLQRAKLVKPFGYVLKPYEIAELHAVIETTLSRSTKESHEEEEEKPFVSEGSSEEEQKLSLIKASPVLSNIPKNIQSLITESGSIVSLNGGQSFSSDSGFLVLSGRLAAIMSSSEGKELVVELLPPGDDYGILHALFPKAHDLRIRAQIDSKIFKIPLSTIHNIAEKFPNFWGQCAEALATRLGRTYELAKALAHGSVESRIIHALVTLSPRMGKGVDAIRLFLTRRELADLVGTTPETAIRITKNLERGGLLDLSRPGVIKIPSMDALASVTTSTAI